MANEASLDNLRAIYERVRAETPSLNSESSDFAAASLTYARLKQYNGIAAAINRCVGDAVVPCMPPHLQINNHNKCNLRCVQCMYFGEDNAGPNHDKDILRSRPNMDTVEALCREGFPYANNSSLSGIGEGLLHHSAELIAQLAGEYGVRMMLNTNGQVLMSRRIRHLFGIGSLMFSIDGGLPHTFESLRLGAKYATVIRNMRTLSRANELLPRPLRMHTRISFTTCVSNMIELPLMVELAAAVGIRELAVSSFTLYDRGPFALEMIAPHQERFERLYAIAEEKAKTLGVSLFRTVSPVYTPPYYDPDQPGGRLMVDYADPFDESRLVPLTELVPTDSVEDDAREIAADALEAGIIRKLTQATPQQTEAAAEAVEALAAGIRDFMNSTPGIANLGEAVTKRKIREPGSWRPICGYLFSSLYLSGNGIAQPCCNDKMDWLADYRKTPIKEVFSGQPYREMLARFHSDSPPQACKDCHFRGYVPEESLVL
ncbi:radical SAM/SPASM domain-containing protein [Paramagnetospirillum magneticum]|uniref:Predicted Fe-S oxidoreductase n=1 Tax=Paramagnetospirillum magneticum (strain ATCC 700264 / AMB-1) TaxID=342108 RepID=Q2W264_PARM1|nr:radical SAM/SPASM domain-containing protein [Paramagnetospirillum magneticum]BAE52061.1 Predicted Fe-S oxidoreductase [Paramagnetospirillum magneticum AMB-1]